MKLVESDLNFENVNPADAWVFSDSVRVNVTCNRSSTELPVAGGIVLATGLGGLELLGHDAQEIAEELVSHFHLNPASQLPRIFLLLAQQATPAHLWVFAAGATAYAAVRFMEAYGLWRGRVWAEWFAVISSGIYVPLELWELTRGPTWPQLTLLAINPRYCELSRLDVETEPKDSTIC